MSDYTQITSFGPKDSLATGNPSKLIKGTEVDPEFAAIATAILSKYDSDDLASQAQAEAGTNNTALMTPLRAAQLDDVKIAAFAAAATFTAAVSITATSPSLKWEESDAAADNKIWRATVNGEAFSLQVGSDALVYVSFLDVERTANVVDSIAFTATAMTNSGTFTNTGAATLSSTLGVVGAVTLSSTLAVTGISTFSAALRAANGSVGAPSYSFSGDVDTGMFYSGSNDLALTYGGTSRLLVRSTGIVDYNSPDFNAEEVGFRNVIRQTTGGTLTAAMRGTCQSVSADVTVNNSVFAAGDVLSVYNNSASAISIIAGTITTMRLAGTTSTGTRTLAPRGLATIWFQSATEAIVSGAGVS